MNIVPANQDMNPMQVAEVFVQSGMFPDAKSVATAAAKLIVGRGLGLTDYDSMSGLHIIKGKCVLASNTMSSAIKASGKYDYRAVTTKEECTITFYSVGGGKREEIGSTTFTMQDAADAGLRGDNWRKWPKAMLFARAISSGYREHCPDALGSAPVYVHEHGESEIPDDKPRAVAAQRETPQIQADDQEDPKAAMVYKVMLWCACERKDAYAKAKMLLTCEGIATDGSASHEEFVKVNEMIDDWMKEGVSFDNAITGLEVDPSMEVVDVQKKPEKEADPWEENPWG